MVSIGDYIMRLERRVDELDKHVFDQDIKNQEMFMRFIRAFEKIAEELREVQRCQKELKQTVYRLSKKN